MRLVLRLFLMLAVILSAAFLVFSTDQIKDDFINDKRPLVTMLTNLNGDHGGTGFYVTTPQGKVLTLTNAHVCGLAENGLIYSRNGDVNVLAVIAIYPNHDLCVLSAPAKVRGIQIAKSVRTGENIYVLGHPLLEPKTLSKGQMSGLVKIDVLMGYNVPCEGNGYKKIPVNPNDFMAILSGVQYTCIRELSADTVTANILPGNSGSPVLNAYGHLVGVAFASMTGSARGYIVPLSEIKSFLGDK